MMEEYGYGNYEQAQEEAGGSASDNTIEEAADSAFATKIKDNLQDLNQDPTQNLHK
jgi:hypothetical protein